MPSSAQRRHLHSRRASLSVVKGCDYSTEMATVLLDWIIKPLPDIRGLCVEGQKQGMEDFWHSTAIVDAVRPRLVVTTTGSKYKLKGKINKLCTLDNGFTKTVADTFVRGFPHNWKEIIEAFYGQLEESISILENDFPLTKKKVQKLNTVKNKRKAVKVSQGQLDDLQQSHSIMTQNGIVKQKMSTDDVTITRCGRMSLPPLAAWTGQHYKFSPGGQGVEVTFLTDHAEKTIKGMTKHFLQMPKKTLCSIYNSELSHSFLLPTKTSPKVHGNWTNQTFKCLDNVLADSQADACRKTGTTALNKQADTCRKTGTTALNKQADTCRKTGTTALNKQADTCRKTGTTALNKQADTCRKTGTTALNKQADTRRKTGTTALNKQADTRRKTGTTALNKQADTRRKTGTTALNKQADTRRKTGTTTLNKQADACRKTGTTALNKQADTCRKTGTTALNKQADTCRKTGTTALNKQADTCRKTGTTTLNKQADACRNTRTTTLNKQADACRKTGTTALNKSIMRNISPVRVTKNRPELYTSDIINRDLRAVLHCKPVGGVRSGKVSSRHSNNVSLQTRNGQITKHCMDSGQERGEVEQTDGSTLSVSHDRSNHLSLSSDLVPSGDCSGTELGNDQSKRSQRMGSRLKTALSLDTGADSSRDVPERQSKRSQRTSPVSKVLPSNINISTSSRDVPESGLTKTQVAGCQRAMRSLRPRGSKIRKLSGHKSPALGMEGMSMNPQISHQSHLLSSVGEATHVAPTTVSPTFKSVVSTTANNSKSVVSNRRQRSTTEPGDVTPLSAIDKTWTSPPTTDRYVTNKDERDDKKKHERKTRQHKRKRDHSNGGDDTCDTVSLKRSKKRKITQGNMGGDEEPWSERERELLQRALKEVNGAKASYWEFVSEIVGTRSETECQHMCKQDLQETLNKSKKPQNKDPGSKKKNGRQKGDPIRGRKGTLKRKQDLRDYLDEQNQGYEDDIFDSSPFMTRNMAAASSVFGFNIDRNDVEIFGSNHNCITPVAGASFMSTPGALLRAKMASTRKTPLPVSASKSDGTPVSINRRRADQYIKTFIGRKNKAETAPPSISQTSPQMESSMDEPSSLPIRSLFSPSIFIDSNHEGDDSDEGINPYMYYWNDES